MINISSQYICNFSIEPYFFFHLFLVLVSHNQYCLRYTFGSIDLKAPSWWVWEPYGMPENWTYISLLQGKHPTCCSLSLVLSHVFDIRSQISDHLEPSLSRNHCNLPLQIWFPFPAKRFIRRFTSSRWFGSFSFCSYHCLSHHSHHIFVSFTIF